MIFKILIFVVFLSLPVIIFPATPFMEKCNPIDTLNINDTTKNNSKYYIASYALIGSTSIIGLNSLWYKDYPRSSFHFFNDGNEWLQMDKAGHFATSYLINRIVYTTLNNANSSNKFNLWFSGGLSLGYLTAIEVLDGFSEQWGFSPYDFSANIAGTALFTAQQILWNEQRISVKFSYSKSDYIKYRPDLLGNNFAENILKDYNGQTYWLSVNISSFLNNENNFPNYLNIALGYGANGMIGGDNNDFYNATQITEFQRTRQFYLSPDIDFNKIKTNKKTVKILLNLLNIIKLPAPTLEFSPSKKVKFFPLYF